ncbi:cuticle protein 19-like [Adelges cooleyi]|uniref:cuticle protein 19-like n=1 Tax=Adelges cooleyi TaxID=133065 RepID=UPI00217F95DB|nr:cuticle protein 19-like [Adelges cooleyi]
MAAKMIVLAVGLMAVFTRISTAFPPDYDGVNHNYHEDREHHSPKPYHFEYGVKDVHTQDIKNQYETSDGHGNVKGSYSLVEADGSTRLVEYTADPVHGFQAKVKKIGPTYRHEPIIQPYPKPSSPHKFY